MNNNEIMDLSLSGSEFEEKYKRQKTVAIFTLGCKVNQYETEAMTEQFKAKGYKIVDFNDFADIYVVNTCTVTNIADQKSRKMLSKAKRNNEAGLVVAVGCYVQVAHEKMDEIPYIDVLIGNTQKDRIVEIVESHKFGQHEMPHIQDVHHNITYEELSIHEQQDKTRSMIKIQDGCDQYCSYCIIPYTRGKVRSRALAAIVSEVEALVAKGFYEVVLTGIHLASYGKDIGDVALIDVLERLQKIEGLQRIRLGSLEPNLITEDFVRRLSTCDKLCPQFHLSMQSGSDSVLQRMNRRYSTESFYKKVALLREYYDRPAITTDVIVGFPGETEEEALETEEFVRRVGFSEVHVFKYSVREGTKAARMKPQVDGRIKTERSKRLVAIVEQLKQEYLETFIHESVSVLVEEEQEIEGKVYAVGHTPRHIRVYIPVKDFQKGQVIHGVIQGRIVDGLIAQTEN